GRTWGVSNPISTIGSYQGAGRFISVLDNLYFTTYGGYGDDTTYVMKSTDNGETFVPFDQGLPPIASPIVAGGQAILASSSYLFLSSFDLGSGNQLWRLPNYFPLRVLTPAAGELVRS